MKLSKLLDEALGTGAIAMVPVSVLGGKPPKKDEKEVHRPDEHNRWYIPSKNPIRQKGALSEEAVEESDDYGTDSNKPADKVWPKEESAQGDQPQRWYHQYATDVKRNRYGTKDGFS